MRPRASSSWAPSRALARRTSKEPRPSEVSQAVGQRWPLRASGPAGDPSGPQMTLAPAARPDPRMVHLGRSRPKEDKRGDHPQGVCSPKQAAAVKRKGRQGERSGSPSAGRKHNGFAINGIAVGSARRQSASKGTTERRSNEFESKGVQMPNRFIRLPTALAAILAVVLLAAACGGSQPDKLDVGAAGQAAPEATPGPEVAAPEASTGETPAVEAAPSASAIPAAQPPAPRPRDRRAAPLPRRR